MQIICINVVAREKEKPLCIGKAKTTLSSGNNHDKHETSWNSKGFNAF